jgi:uncharacterized paraquat-inducible protein A
MIERDSLPYCHYCGAIRRADGSCPRCGRPSRLPKLFAALAALVFFAALATLLYVTLAPPD